MPDYYIRTPDQDESRGPFNIQKLLTLAEAEQINENTLYYDETKEEWIPFALNGELKAEIFPERKKLSLKIGEDEEDEAPAENSDEGQGVSVDDLLKAAEADTKETRHVKNSRKSFERAVAVAGMTLGIMMLFSAISFVMPHLSIIEGAINEQNYPLMLNFPFLLIGMLDLVLAILLLLSVNEVFPLVRVRGMLGLGFGVYVGWALGDPMIMLAFGLGGAGVFLATITQKLSLMLIAVLTGIGGNGFLAYLALSGRFSEFYTTVQIGLSGG